MCGKIKLSDMGLCRQLVAEQSSSESHGAGEVPTRREKVVTARTKSRLRLYSGDVDGLTTGLRGSRHELQHAVTACSGVSVMFRPATFVAPELTHNGVA